MSIYIPRVNYHVSEDFIKYTFMTARIGEVIRIDFTPINKRPGFGENVDNVVKSAFVHFNSYPNHPEQFQESWNFWTSVSEGKGFKFYPGTVQEGYWLILPAKKPIQQTMMNTSQIVENGRYLENLIDEQAKTIDKQAKTIEDQECRIEKMMKMCEATQSVVYQLLGGLFNQESQSQMLQGHLNILFSEELPCKYEEDTDKWENWPTTRQGDENERRIHDLERKLEILTDNLLENIQYDDNESESTHSSMPDLIEAESDSSDSSDRLLMTRELCGNE